jgi:hypothetical protein
MNELTVQPSAPASRAQVEVGGIARSLSVCFNIGGFRELLSWERYRQRNNCRVRMVSFLEVAWGISSARGYCGAKQARRRFRLCWPGLKADPSRPVSIKDHVDVKGLKFDTTATSTGVLRQMGQERSRPLRSCRATRLSTRQLGFIPVRNLNWGVARLPASGLPHRTQGSSCSAAAAA